MENHKKVIMDVINRLQEFIESEGKSCSYDPELVTPLYVYRMWGGTVPLEEIDNGLKVLRSKSILCGLHI